MGSKNSLNSLSDLRYSPKRINERLVNEQKDSELIEIIYVSVYISLTKSNFSKFNEN